jgi:hypothetical protein
MSIDLQNRSKQAKSRKGLTYRDQCEKDEDKAQLLRLIDALGAPERALRLDECEAWRIQGSRGHIYGWGDGQAWVMYCCCRSPRGWTSTKKRLAGFSTITQDGDGEGCLKLDRLPTAAEAVIIRDVLGIRKRMALSDNQREALLAHAFPRGRDNRGDNCKILAEKSSEVPDTPPADTEALLEAEAAECADTPQEGCRVPLPQVETTSAVAGGAPAILGNSGE